MALGSGNNIKTRISLQGGDDVKRQLQQIGAAGEKAFSDIGKQAGGVNKSTTAIDELRQHFSQISQAGTQAGNQVRATLLAATSGLSSFADGAKTSAVSSGQMRFALQNLSFQVNDVATSLLSGASPCRVFAQQGGQFVVAFQQGGGVGPVLRGVGAAIAGFVTPTTAAVAGLVALAAVIGVVVDRAASSQASARQFDVVLKGLGKSSQATGADLEKAAQQLRNVGLSADEARKGITQALRNGVNPTDVARIVTIGQDLNAVLGEGSLQKFIDAAAKGGEPLQDFARQLGILPKVAADASLQLFTLSDATTKSTDAINDALRKRGQSLVDEQRSVGEQLADLTRKRGSAQEEIEFASQRRIQAINRESARAINEIILQRNRDNAKRLAEFNKQVEDSAQKALGDKSLIDQIGNRVSGSFRASLGPLQETFLNLRIAWLNFLDAMANSAIVQKALSILQQGLKLLTSGLEALGQSVKNSDLSAFLVIVAAAVPVVAALTAAFSALSAVVAPVGVGLAAIATAVSWPVVLLAGLIAITAAFVDWKAVLDGTTWRQFLGTVDALGNLLRALGGYLADQFVQLVAGALQSVQDAFTAMVNWIGSKVNDALGFLQRLIDAAKAVASAIGAAVTGGSAEFPSATGASGGLVQTFASGGRIRGPGTGTSDSIWARLSDGEFVINAKATAAFLPLLEAINGGMNLMPQRRSFATGGLAAVGGGGGTPVHLHLDGKSFAMRGDVDGVRDLAKTAARARLTSAGRVPSWA